MKVCVKLFAAARQAVDRQSIEIELPQSSTIADLRRAIECDFPLLHAVAHHSRFAVNSQFAEDSTSIGPDSEIACIPPVSGG